MKAKIYRLPSGWKTDKDAKGTQYYIGPNGEKTNEEPDGELVGQVNLHKSFLNKFDVKVWKSSAKKMGLKAMFPMKNVRGTCMVLNRTFFWEEADPKRKSVVEFFKKLQDKRRCPSNCDADCEGGPRAVCKFLKQIRDYEPTRRRLWRTPMERLAQLILDAQDEEA